MQIIFSSDPKPEKKDNSQSDILQSTRNELYGLRLT